MFDRATITLGIGPHSSYMMFTISLITTFIADKLQLIIAATYHAVNTDRSLVSEATHPLLQAFVSCCLDYCNSLLDDVSEVHLQVSPVSMRQVRW